MKEILGKLGFLDLISYITGYCDSELGRISLSDLVPLKEREGVERELKRTQEMRLFLKLGSKTGLQGIRDIKDLLRDLEIEGRSLSLEGLVRIRDLLLGYHSIRLEISNRRNLVTSLWGIVEGLDSPKDLIKAFQSAISPEGDLREDASPLLLKIRQQKSKQRQMILKKCDSLIKERNIRIDQEISIRGGRYVIPLRVEDKGKLKGIVHDYSKSKNTCYIEPFVLVPENNRLHELEEEERQEIERILRELTEKVRPWKDELLRIRGTVAYLDGIVAKARFAEEFNLKVPELCEDGVDISEAKNPLLLILMREQDKGPVPGDFRIREGSRMLLVCGPNRGGKTVALKTLGLISLMTQTGIPVPVAEGSKLCVFQEILLEIGDEQDVFLGESTFSAHAKGLAKILSKARKGSLVLIDEPGMGTSPEEGSAIALSVLEALLESGAISIITTHYDALKAWAVGRSSVIVASVGFDFGTQSPNFQLIYGIVGSSHALEIAQRSGLPTPIIERARSFMGSQKIRMDEILRHLEERLREVEDLRRTYNEGVEKNRLLAEELLRKEAELKERLQEITQQKRAELERIFYEAKKEIAQIINRFKEERGRPQVITQKSLKELKEKIEGYLQMTPFQEQESPSKIKPGDLVVHQAFGKTGTVLEINGNRAVVQFSGIKVELDARSLNCISGNEGKENITSVARWEFKSPLVLELNVIGQRVPEAISMVEKAINRALVEGREELRIVHGHGTGQLRKAIREHLKGFPFVKNLRPEDPAFGGEAVTVVEL